MPWFFLIMMGIYAYALHCQSSSQAYDYMLLLGVSMFFRCARNINMVTSRKKLNMMPIFFIELGSAVCALVVSLICVVVYKNGWAMAVGYFSGSVMYTLLSFILLPKNGCVIRLSLVKARKIFGYSKWIFCTAQIVSFFENIIPLFVSQMFGLKTLGLFEKSDLYSRKIIGQINQVFWIVGLPWASDSEKQGKQAYKLISLILLPFVLLVVSILVTISIFIPKILIIVGGPSWADSEEIVRALCVVSATACLNMPFGIVMQAIKLPKLSFFASVTKLLAFLIIFWATEYYSVVEFIYSLVWANIVTTCFYFTVCFFKIDKGIGQLLQDVLILSFPFLLFHLYGYGWIAQFDSIVSSFFVILICALNFAVGFGLTSVKKEALVAVRRIYHSLRKSIVEYKI